MRNGHAFRKVEGICGALVVKVSRGQDQGCNDCVVRPAVQLLVAKPVPGS